MCPQPSSLDPIALPISATLLSNYFSIWVDFSTILDCSLNIRVGGSFQGSSQGSFERKRAAWQSNTVSPRGGNRFQIQKIYEEGDLVFHRG